MIIRCNGNIIKDKYNNNRLFDYQIASILFTITMHLAFYKNSILAQTYPDSMSYINFPFNDLLSFQLSSHRVPGYSLILYIFRFILGPTLYLYGVVAFQAVLSIISINLLYKTIVLISNQKTIAFFITILYGCSPSVIGWNVLILTESLSLSYVVIFIHQITLYIFRPSKKLGIIIILETLVFTFIKPALLIFDIALLIFWILRYIFMKDERSILLILIGISLASHAIICTYSYIVFLQWGTFGLSPQGPSHLLAACLKSGLYKLYPNTALTQQIYSVLSANNFNISGKTLNMVIPLIVNTIDTEADIQKEILKFCKVCIQGDIVGYFKYIVLSLVKHFNLLYSSAYNTFTSNNTPIFKLILELQNLLFSGLKLGHVFLCGVVEMVYTFAKPKLQSSLFWVHLGTGMLIIFNYLYIFVGTYAEEMRSTIYLIPFFYVSFSLFLKSLMLYIKSK